jgi:preprotein translocase subunit SecF
VPSNKKFDFVHTSRRFLMVSAVILLIGLIALGVRGLNYGIDFSSGTTMDIVTSKPVEAAQVRAFLDAENVGEYSLTSSTTRETIRFKDTLNAAQENKIRTDFSSQFDKNASYEVNIVDADIAREQQRNAIIGVALACIGIIIYVSIRFEWRFAIAAVAALVYDALFVICLFSIFRLEVNLPFILAVLTIIGYSINDTVVIFDRIRENMRFAKIKTGADLDALVNKSIWQTLHRSVNTVITVLLAAGCLFIFGGVSIRLFSLAMIFGLISGAYSSIFIASQLWLYLKKKQPIKKAVKAPVTP